MQGQGLDGFHCHGISRAPSNRAVTSEAFESSPKSGQRALFYFPMRNEAAARKSQASHKAEGRWSGAQGLSSGPSHLAPAPSVLLSARVNGMAVWPSNEV